MNRRNPLIVVIYIIIGVIMASNRGYLVGLGELDHILSAVLAIVLWPLLLLGINFHIDF